MSNHRQGIAIDSDRTAGLPPNFDAIHHSHLCFDNFSGAILGLRLAQLVTSPAATEPPTEISDCFAHTERFLHQPQTFKAQLSKSEQLLNALPVLLRYRSDYDFAHWHRRYLDTSTSDETAALCQVLSDVLSLSFFSKHFSRNFSEAYSSITVRRQALQAWSNQLHQRSDQCSLSAERSHQYLGLWQNVITLTQASNAHRSTTSLPKDSKRNRSIIGGIASALLHPSSYTLAVTQSAQWGGLAPYVAGLIVGNWTGHSAVPLLLQLQITTTEPQLLGRTYCQTIAKCLFNQWAGRRADG